MTFYKLQTLGIQHWNFFWQFMNLVEINSWLIRRTYLLDNVYLLSSIRHLLTRRLYLTQIKIKANRLTFLEFLLLFLQGLAKVS